VEPSIAVVEKESKMIMERSGKSCGIYSYLQVTMEGMKACLHILLQTNPAAYNGRLQEFPTVLLCAASRSDVT